MNLERETSYRAPAWLPGAHAQTVYAALLAPRSRVTYRRERWETPDGDFIDLDWVVKPAEVARRFNLTDGKEYTQPSLSSDDSILEKMEPATVPLVVLFHGLEGSSRSHYALAVMSAVKDGRCTVGLRINKSNWANTIDQPPFEAYAVTCGVTFSFGGVKISNGGEVEDTAGKPIPGLYAAGELVGGIFYHNYPGGTGLTSGAVFGRLCGTSAAAYVKKR